MPIKAKNFPKERGGEIVAKSKGKGKPAGKSGGKCGMDKMGKMGKGM